MRYRFYREHKYVTYRLYQHERNCAQSDFTVDEEVLSLKLQLESIMALMLGHASHEDHAIHPLLQAKGSKLAEPMAKEHQQHAATFQRLFASLEEILNVEDKGVRLHLGYQYYLTYRLFVCQNLQHLHEEETLLLPELQRLYTDDELREIDKRIYAQMSVEDMVEMLVTLFPHINTDDRHFFLEEISMAAPQKYSALLAGIRALLTAEERAKFNALLNAEKIA
jgi:hypothetical protein